MLIKHEKFKSGIKTEHFSTVVAVVLEGPWTFEKCAYCTESPILVFGITGPNPVWNAFVNTFVGRQRFTSQLTSFRNGALRSNTMMEIIICGQVSKKKNLSLLSNLNKSVCRPI